LFRQFNRFASLIDPQGDRFLGVNLLAGFERGLRDVVVTFWGSKVDDNLDRSIVENFFERTVALHLVVPGESAGSLRVAIIDAGELKDGMIDERLLIVVGDIPTAYESDTHDSLGGYSFQRRRMESISSSISIESSRDISAHSRKPAWRQRCTAETSQA